MLKQQYVVDTKTMILLAEYTDLKHGGKPMLGKSGVQTIKAGWTNDKPTAPGTN
ncbi:hypothetical protein AB0C28_54680 [Nonomuraea sp. NPDC048892]|uniref:hypothetical protein n=1 Tax=Nonomuraea sp. NPDC048892 TaxID=3154624 RepID=UPI0034067536